MCPQIAISNNFRGSWLDRFNWWVPDIPTTPFWCKAIFYRLLLKKFHICIGVIHPLYTQEDGHFYTIHCCSWHRYDTLGLLPRLATSEKLHRGKVVPLYCLPHAAALEPHTLQKLPPCSHIAKPSIWYNKVGLFNSIQTSRANCEKNSLLFQLHR